MFQIKVVRKYKTNYVQKRFSKNRVDNGIMWKTVVQPDRPQMAVRRMRFACWIPKATDTHSEYEIIIAFPQQQWLCECATMIRYTNIACLLLLLNKSSGSKLGRINLETVGLHVLN
jgi:hypothetical protein